MCNDCDGRHRNRGQVPDLAGARALTTAAIEISEPDVDLSTAALVESAS